MTQYLSNLLEKPVVSAKDVEIVAADKEACVKLATADAAKEQRELD